MIMISSEAGVRLAKARAELDRLGMTAHHKLGPKDTSITAAALVEYHNACAEVSHELVRDRFHLMTGP